MTSNSKIWDEFMDSEYAQSQLQKTAEVDPYSVDPGNKTELNKSVETHCVAPGAKDKYTTKPAPTPGGAEKFADPVVEGLEDIHNQMMAVVNREPTGKVAKKVKDFVKKADMDDDGELFDVEEEMEDDSEKGIDQLLEELRHEDIVEESDEDPIEYPSVIEEGDELLIGHSHDLDASSSVKKVFAALNDLVIIADELDLAGQHEDAKVLDTIITDEFKALASLKKK